MLVTRKHLNGGQEIDEITSAKFDGHTSIMLYMMGVAKDLYTCNRPPCATCAMIVQNRSFRGDPISILAGVSPPAGSETCKEIGCEMVDGHCVRTIHAEQRAIAIAASMGVITKGASMYSLLKPCYACSKLIVAAGISKIYYVDAAYDEERTRKLLERAQVECTRLE